MFALMENVQIYLCYGTKGDGYETERLKLTKEFSPTQGVQLLFGAAEDPNTYFYGCLDLGYLYCKLTYQDNKEFERSPKWCVTAKKHHISLFYLPKPLPRDKQWIKDGLTKVVNNWKKHRQYPLSRPKNVPPYRMVSLDTRQFVHIAHFYQVSHVSYTFF